jgi:hypothetical protein
MNLYIKVENGLTTNHPASEENLIQVFGEIPPDWEPFARIEPPVLKEFEKFDDPHVIYKKIDNVWTDVYQIVQMSPEEKYAKDQADKQLQIDSYKEVWKSLPQRDNFSAWIFNEETIKYEPPIPRPTDRDVIWNGANNEWVDKPPKPDDGKIYRIDFYTLSWVEVQQE